MDKPIGSVDVDKDAEISQAGDAAGADIAFGEFVDNAFLDALAGFGVGLAFGKDEAAAFAVDLDDANVNFLANHFAPALLGGIPGHLGTARQADL